MNPKKKSKANRAVLKQKVAIAKHKLENIHSLLYDLKNAEISSLHIDEQTFLLLCQNQIDAVQKYLYECDDYVMLDHINSLEAIRAELIIDQTEKQDRFIELANFTEQALSA